MANTLDLAARFKIQFDRSPYHMTEPSKSPFNSLGDYPQTTSWVELLGFNPQEGIASKSTYCVRYTRLRRSYTEQQFSPSAC